MKNGVLPRQSDILFHPLVLGTIVLYFLNNSLFQRYWLSLITGKLSDFTWLFFTPIVICSFATGIVPQKSVKNTRFDVVIWLIIGLLYTLVKMLPAANSLVVNALDGIGIPSIIVIDPTDLLALISLPIGYYFWRANYGWSRSSSLSRSLLLFSIVALLTLADSAQYDYGIRCFKIVDNGIVASNMYWDEISTDGGKTWNDYGSNFPCEDNSSKETQFSKIGTGQLRARFEPGQPIEISSDGGKTWRIEYQLATQAQRAFYMKTSDELFSYNAGPFDAVIDSQTGNLLFAMGLEGVLIREPNSDWQWVEIGTYKKLDFTKPNLFILLWGEGVLALVGGLLTFTVLGMKTGIDKNNPNRGCIFNFTVLAWISLGITVFIFTPALSSGEGIAISDPAIFINFLLSFILALSIIEYSQIKRNPASVKILILSSMAGVCLFLLPYLFWAFNFLHTYRTAAVLAFLSLAGVNILGWRNLSATNEQSSTHE
jgi:hypothetical protein